MLTEKQKRTVNDLARSEVVRAIESLRLSQKLSEDEITLFVQAFMAGAAFGMIAFEQLLYEEEIRKEMH